MRTLAVLLLGVGLLTACSSARTKSCPGGQPPAASGLTGYRLGPEDQIQVTVFRQPELSGQFALDGQGSVALPLVGNVQAAGLTTRELEDEIEQRLKSEHYLVNPQVGVEPLIYRPFYVLGEVNHPGSYEYRNDITVVNAVALAGGYTYRAKESRGLDRARRLQLPDQDRHRGPAGRHPDDSRALLLIAGWRPRWGWRPSAPAFRPAFRLWRGEGVLGSTASGGANGHRARRQEEVVMGFDRVGARLAALSCAALVTWGLGSAPALAAGELRIANAGEPDTLDPHHVEGTWENRIIGDMFMGLTTEAADGSVIPGRRRKLAGQR